MDEFKSKQQKFVDEMLSQQLWLHRFFSIGLSSVKVEKEAMIQDMIQETAEKAWKNYLKPKYVGKPIHWLIQQKARNVLLDKLAELKKKHSLNKLIKFTEKPFTPSFQQELENRDILNYIHETSEDVSGFEICSLLVAGYSHNEIKELLPYTKETKMKLSRYRKEIRARALIRQ